MICYHHLINHIYQYILRKCTKNVWNLNFYLLSINVAVGICFYNIDGFSEFIFFFIEQTATTTKKLIKKCESVTGRHIMAAIFFICMNFFFLSSSFALVKLWAFETSFIYFALFLFIAGTLLTLRQRDQLKLSIYIYIIYQ